MVERSPLTLAFLDKKPLAASRVLAAMAPEDAASFLQAIPTRFVAPVLSEMGAWPAASVVSQMDESVAAANLQILEYQEALTILRHLSGEKRNRIFQELPEKLKRNFETSLTFPDDTIGAHMNKNVVTLRGDHTIADAIEQVRRTLNTNLETIFVVDAEKKLVGVITSSALLRYSRSTLLADVVDRDVDALSSRARISKIKDLDGWHDYRDLPVISRKKHVIGSLSRKTMRGILAKGAIASAVPESSIASSLVEAYIVSASGFVTLLASGAQKPREEKRVLA